jgi:import inner membrane translocase subunit TIM8
VSGLILCLFKFKKIEFVFHSSLKKKRMNVSDPSKLLEKDPELVRFIEQQEEAVRYDKAVHKITEQCWNVCVSSPAIPRLDSKTESCLVNCVERFIDASNEMVKHFSNKLESEVNRSEFSQSISDHTTHIDSFANESSKATDEKSKFKFW